MNTSLIKKTVLALLALAVASGCASAANPEASGTPRETTVALSAEAVEACERVMSRQIMEPEEQLVLVADKTASMVPSTLSPALRDKISEVSRADGAITVIAVDGADGPPVLLATNAALSTEGERDRPSVAQLAANVPVCVERLLESYAPTAPGTDLYAALALATEVLRPTSAATVWVVSDMISTSGRLLLTESALFEESTVAATASVESAPLDLGGARLRIDGLGSTSTPLTSADRAWLRDYVQALCGHWNATGCEDIASVPTNAAAPSTALPSDPVPTFPQVVAASEPTSCVYTLPAALTFAGDSASLREGAEEMLAGPIALALAQSGSPVLVTGHTASTHAYTREQHLALSQDRADAVAGVIRAGGVDADRVRSIGVGDEQPLAEDIDPETGKQNENAAAERRVTVVVDGVPCA